MLLCRMIATSFSSSDALILHRTFPCTLENSSVCLDQHGMAVDDIKRQSVAHRWWSQSLHESVVVVQIEREKGQTDNRNIEKEDRKMTVSKNLLKAK